MVENEYNRGKVDNEYDFCSVTDLEIKSQLEKAFLKARVSYFLRWDTPGFFSRVFSGAKTKIIFCVNSAQIETAEQVIIDLELGEAITLIKRKSQNKQGY